MKLLFVFILSLFFGTSLFADNLFKSFKDRFAIEVSKSTWNKTNTYTFGTGLYNPFNSKCCSYLSVYEKKDSNRITSHMYGVKISSDIYKNFLDIANLNVFIEGLAGLGQMSTKNKIYQKNKEGKYKSNSLIGEVSTGVGVKYSFKKLEFFSSVNFYENFIKKSEVLLNDIVIKPSNSFFVPDVVYSFGLRYKF